MLAVHALMLPAPFWKDSGATSTNKPVVPDGAGELLVTSLL
jgi:hypothetical protein